METVTEVLASDGSETLVHPGWRERWPWLLQGITRGGAPDRDLGLFGDAPGSRVHGRWERLLVDLEMTSAVHARQPHGRTVRSHLATPAGLTLAPACDGHLTRQPGVVLAVSVADCVPLYLVEPEERVVGVIHAGWRGVAAGILEAATEALGDRFGISPHQLHLHLGPSICGGCYEVGPEVHAGLGLPEPGVAEPVDLKRLLAARSRDVGIPPGAVSRSSHCTLCGPATLFSHRGGDAGRQMALIGVRP